MRLRFIVAHLEDRVDYFELWNEPDIPGYCPKWIQVDDYVNLARRTIPVIREVAPDAKIVGGGVSNLRFEPAPDWLFALLESDEIMPLVDVISWHPMYSTSAAYEVYEDCYYAYPQIVQDIKDTAAAHGFTGEYQADEIGWATLGNARPDQPWEYTPTVAYKYYGRGILMHLGMDIGVGVPDDNPVIRTLATLMDGASALDVPVEVDSTATNIVHYTFALPDGDHYVALWTDGIAVDDDPGVEATLTVPGYSARAVTGIDVLYGFRQELDYRRQGGDTIIGNLLVKDYPTIIRLTPAP